MDSPSWLDGFWLRGRFDPPARGPVAFGGTLSGTDLLLAHSNALLPMPSDRVDAGVNRQLYAHGCGPGKAWFVGAPDRSYDLAWWSPDPRPILTARCVRVGAGLARTLRACRHWTTTVDRAFDQVVDACREGREPRWLTDQLVSTMRELYESGWYHSVEVWSGSRLVGGAVGLGRGAVFSADTMFHRESGASRIALVDLVGRLTPSRTLDLQWDSPHIRRLGASLMARRDYLALAASGVDRIALPTDRRAVGFLLSHPPGSGTAAPRVRAHATEIDGR